MASPTTGTPDASAIRSAVRPRRRWLWILSLLVALATIGLFFAPAWVARHVHKAGVVLGDDSNQAFSLRAEKVSLGWFSPAKLSDVSILDGQGQSLLTAESVVSERPLMRLLMDRRRPGRFTITKPYLDVRVREDGSNLEDLIHALLSRNQSGGDLAEGAIAIADGRIDFHGPQGTLLATIENVDFAGSHRRGTDREIECELTAIVVQEGERRSVESAVHWRGPGEALPLMSGKGTAGVKFDPLSVRLLQPYLNRSLPELEIHDGSLAGQLLIECDLTGTQTIAATSQLLVRDLHATSRNSSGQASEYRWDDEELALQIDGTFDPQEDAITFSDVTFQSTPVSVIASGTISDVDGESLLDVSGNLQYDISPLVDSLESEFEQHVHIEGLQTRSIRVHGPLAHLTDDGPRWDASRLNLEADLGWESADVFGVKSEQAAIVAHMKNGILSIDPRHVPVSGGRFTAHPQVTILDRHPRALIGSGPVLEDVEFSPEMCRLWLKYLSPPLADATRINGRFSISFEEGRIPLDRASDSQLRGLLHVHAAEVRPGAFAERLIGIVVMIQELIAGKPGWSPAGNSQLLAMHDQQVRFVMEQGRVHHEHVEFTVAGAAVRTSGSVGLDDSLDLVITIPLPASWLSKNDLRAVLGGDELIIPVRGTLDRPQFDLQPFRELAQRIAIRATGGFLQKLLD